MPSSGSGSASGVVSVGVYTSPTAADIRKRTGLNEHMDALTAAAFDAVLLSLLPDAEVRTALSVTPEVWESAELTSYQVAALQIAACKRTGADYLRSLASKVVSGTETPILVEEAAAWRAQADALEAEAVLYDNLAVGVDPGAPGTAGETLRAGTPILVTGTFAPASLTWRPSDRIGSLDERDNRSAGKYDR